MVIGTANANPFIAFYPSRVTGESLWTLTTPTVIATNHVVYPGSWEWVPSLAQNLAPLPAIPPGVPYPTPQTSNFPSVGDERIQMTLSVIESRTWADVSKMRLGSFAPRSRLESWTRTTSELGQTFESEDILLETTEGYTQSSSESLSEAPSGSSSGLPREVEYYEDLGLEEWSSYYVDKGRATRRENVDLGRHIGPSRWIFSRHSKLSCPFEVTAR